MKNSELPAMPATIETQYDETPRGLALYKDVLYPGLSKREMFAMAAMQGLTSSVSEYSKFHELATDAVSIADALLAELERV